MSAADLYPLFRPFLFGLSPERAHEFVLESLDRMVRAGKASWIVNPPADDERHVFGLRFRNAVGLAAGLDKDARYIDALAALGFGFIEVGTVTPRPQPGNPKPRMFRLARERALINRMGFNNDGLDAFLERIKSTRFQGVLGVNLGKNADTPIERAIDDYLIGLKAVYPYASYVTLNVSSPNTRNLRQLQDASALDVLLATLKLARQELAAMHRRSVPLVVKIAPDLEPGQLEDMAEILLRHGIDGVIATNTTIARPGLAGVSRASETGGLSGAPLLPAANGVLQEMRRLLGPGFPIIGVGGILSGADAAAKIRLGADLIQLYTGLIYRGPGLIAECARAIRDLRSVRA